MLEDLSPEDKRREFLATTDRRRPQPTARTLLGPERKTSDGLFLDGKGNHELSLGGRKMRMWSTVQCLKEDTHRGGDGHGEEITMPRWQNQLH